MYGGGGAGGVGVVDADVGEIGDSRPLEPAGMTFARTARNGGCEGGLRVLGPIDDDDEIGGGCSDNCLALKLARCGVYVGAQVVAAVGSPVTLVGRQPQRPTGGGPSQQRAPCLGADGSCS